MPPRTASSLWRITHEYGPSAWIRHAHSPISICIYIKGDCLVMMVTRPDPTSTGPIHQDQILAQYEIPL